GLGDARRSREPFGEGAQPLALAKLGNERMHDRTVHEKRLRRRIRPSLYVGIASDALATGRTGRFGEIIVSPSGNHPLRSQVPKRALATGVRKGSLGARPDVPARLRRRSVRRGETRAPASARQNPPLPGPRRG